MGVIEGFLNDIDAIFWNVINHLTWKQFAAGLIIMGIAFCVREAFKVEEGGEE